MRIPISYALNWPNRINFTLKKIDENSAAFILQGAIDYLNN